MQVGLSSLLFTLLGYFLFGLESKSAIIVGLALALSSTAIVLKILNESHDIHSGYGRAALGILLFQDLAVIPILLMVSFFTSTTNSMGTILLETLGGAAIIFAVLFVIGKYFVERFFDWIMLSESEEIFLVAVLLGVISASYFAEVMGFTYSLEAFLAGMLLSETKYRYRIEADLIPFRDILLGGGLFRYHRDAYRLACDCGLHPLYCRSACGDHAAQGIADLYDPTPIRTDTHRAQDLDGTLSGRAVRTGCLRIGTLQRADLLRAQPDTHHHRDPIDDHHPLRIAKY